MKVEAPHSGYHWRGQSERFFEGWYLRVTLSAIAQTFAFMYSIDDPLGNSSHSGGAAQILGPNESYYCRSFPNTHRFWASPSRLAVGHQRIVSQTIHRAQATLQTGQPISQTTRDIAAGDLDTWAEGYRFTAHHHQGRLLSPIGEVQAEWEYSIEPVSTWGKSASPKATAGWLSYLPIFEPGWQVLMAHGWASGQIYWQGKTYSFENEPAYTEKNWGGAFPSKWFWLQCNAFADAPGLSITAAGGIREMVFLKENVGLIGIHYQGEFYEFLSTQTELAWTVEPWGHWHLSARSDRYRVEITGWAHDQGAYVRVPTRDGLQWLCRDTTHGDLRVRLWTSDGKIIVEARSNLAGLEVGGAPWKEAWVVKS